MSWMQIYYGVGTIVGMVVVYFVIMELGKIVREKDDYDDKVDLPD